MCEHDRLSTTPTARVGSAKTPRGAFIDFLFFLNMLSWFAICTASWLGSALSLFCFVLSGITVKSSPVEYRAKHIALLLLSLVFFCASITAPGIHQVIWG
ncbi:hypothetical protein [Edwardsiella tarda]|uniref:hypothetical protein n=1 Tax=Edwardsiella tarda TaxID=636 RepID=UPI003F655A7D